jgi:hypothetical protein
MVFTMMLATTVTVGPTIASNQCSSHDWKRYSTNQCPQNDMIYLLLEFVRFVYVRQKDVCQTKIDSKIQVSNGQKDVCQTKIDGLRQKMQVSIKAQEQNS